MVIMEEERLILIEIVWNGYIKWNYFSQNESMDHPYRYIFIIWM